MPGQGISSAAASALTSEIGSPPPEYRPLPDQPFLYEAPERFGESLTTNRPWNTSALAAVERLNGRVAMLGFVAAIVGELISGHGPAGQVWALLRWTIG